MGRLRDKIVLVTGAAGAIGSATADAIVEAGGIAITTDLGGSAGMDHALDVTSEADWLRVVAEIERAAERLDGLVNAAGIAAIGSVEDTDLSTWRRVIAVNLDGTFLGCKHALPLLKRSGGAIVNLSSVSGLVGGHNLAAYNASKGGVRLLTKSVALHGARFDPKVRCNSVHPAFIEGPMADALIAQTKDPRAGAGGDEPRRSARPLRQGERGRGSVRLSVVRRIRLRHRGRVRARRRPDRTLTGNSAGSRGDLTASSGKMPFPNAVNKIFVYLWPRKSAQNGGKVRRNPTANNANAAKLTFSIATIFARQSLDKTNQVTSQMMIVTVVLPESGPTGP